MKVAEMEQLSVPCGI